MANRSKILVLLTGGTICSIEDERGERYSDVKRVQIVEHFQRGGSPYAKEPAFDVLAPLDVLSENMTTDTWNQLLACLRERVEWSQYRGIILLHGTDTLAYTAALLSITLTGTKIPVCMVSAHLPLADPQTNGHANFRAAVELILNGIAPNVYAVYRNMDGRMLVHLGAHLLQCASYSNDFYSADAVEIKNVTCARCEGRAYGAEEGLLPRLMPLRPSVLKLTPYVGMDYTRISLDGVEAIVHETFHSESVCVERSRKQGAYSGASVLCLLDACKSRDIPLLLAPCSREAYRYESTGDALENGAHPLYGLTAEMAYVKTLIGCALGLRGDSLVAFCQEEINGESLFP